MKIGLLLAMQKELEFFADNAQNFDTTIMHQRPFLSGQWGKHDIVATVSGMGKVNAALCAATLIKQHQTDLILNIGISGGLDASLQIGDFVLGRDIVYHDVWCGKGNEYGQVQNMPLYYHSDANLVAKLPQFKQGLLCCGDWFVSQTTELNNIKSKFPQALAVDMESAAIAQTCYLYQIPFLCIRQISDTPGAEHHQEQYETFWQHAPQNSIKALSEILEAI